MLDITTMYIISKGLHEVWVITEKFRRSYSTDEESPPIDRIDEKPSSQY